MSVTTRTAAPEDLMALEAVRVATWKDAYRGVVPDAFLDAMEVTEERVGRQVARLRSGAVQMLVAELSGQPVGLLASGPCRDDDLPGVFELYALYVLPAAWRHGCGTALLQAAGDLSSLWVLAGNTRGRRFYEHHGFTHDGTVKQLDWLGPDPVPELRYTKAT